ncbi:MAG: tripartite tricarboxylate transporter substrate-binding protein [Betaproteobacteria bacterium]
MPVSPQPSRRAVATVVLAVVAVLSILARVPARAAEDAWPTRPIRIIVAQAPAGPPDLVARFIAEPLGRALGVPVVVDNRPGASGIIGVTAGAQAAPDGHTLLIGTLSTHVLVPQVNAHVGYDAERDFVPVGTGLALAQGGRIRPLAIFGQRRSPQLPEVPTAAEQGYPQIDLSAVGTDYIAPARMPHELQRAGFRVAMLAPRNSFAAHTAFVDHIGYFPENVKLYEWVGIVAGAVRAVQPALVLPGDDGALRTLMQLVLDPPAGLRPEVQRELGTLIRGSLGDPAGWLDTIDKSRLFEFARRNDIAVADGEIAGAADDAVAIAERIGYPVILRQMFGSAGKGAAQCDDAAAVRAAIRGFGRTDAWSPKGSERLVVQRWLAGDVVNRASAAWNGTELAGFTRGRLATHPGPLGPASVVQFTGHAGVAAATRKLFALTGMHGLIGTQFIIDAESGIPCLIEVNRRMLPATHAGNLVGIDLAAALFPAATERQWTGPMDLPPGPGLRLALFPQEWYRDRESAWLKSLPTDAPWDDPDLLGAMLRLPFERSNPATGIEAGT